MDTNIIVRYISQDDEIQSAKASSIIESELTADSPGYICAIVLVEISWVLQRSYKVDRAMLMTVLERLLRTAEFSIEHREEAWKALRLVHGEGVDFADAYLAHINQKHGCARTLTFDKRAGRMSFFETP